MCLGGGGGCVGVCVRGMYGLWVCGVCVGVLHAYRCV